MRVNSEDLLGGQDNHLIATAGIDKNRRTISVRKAEARPDSAAGSLVECRDGFVPSAG
jgi:hypothetical protein